MKKIGLILVFAGIIISSLISVQDPVNVNWTYFIPIIAISAVGIVMVRLAIIKHSRQEDNVTQLVCNIKESIEAINKEMEFLYQNKANINVYDLHIEIDKRLVDSLDKFANSRECIKTQYGVQNYADVMSHFAAGERYLNRVWSCSTDGYIDEAHEYIDRSYDQFKKVKNLYEKLA